VSLLVHEFGEAGGVPIVALHGLKGHGRRWVALFEGHVPGVRVYAPDLRGHGGSVWEPPWTLERHAADVLETMDAVGLGRAPLVGHSFGAAVALYAARAAPSRVSGLVLLDPGIGLPAALAGRLAEAELAGPPAPVPAGEQRWSAAMAVTSFSESARPVVLPPAGVPTLLVIARRSGSYADLVSYAGACRAVLGDLLTVAEVDCGHRMYEERPAQTGRLVGDFVAAVPRW
jgi:lipase